MKKATSTLKSSLFALLALGITGCASTGTFQAEEQSIPANTFTYEVQPGDRLGDIALSITGNITDWERIARFNGIDDPRSLAAGDTIVIPDELLPETARAKTNGHASNRVATNSHSPLPVLNGTGVSVARNSNNSNDQIAVHPVSVNRSFKLQPIEELPSYQMVSNKPQHDSLLPKIKVIGTYYPKGIYAQPANYAQLKQRVAPGTTFQLDSKINDWYKIVTDDGFGYIRQTDSALVQ